MIPKDKSYEDPIGPRFKGHYGNQVVTAQEYADLTAIIVVAYNIRQGQIASGTAEKVNARDFPVWAYLAQQNADAIATIKEVV